MNNDLTKTFKKVTKTIKHYSPEILTGVAIVTGIAGAVWACKKTLDLEEEIAPVMENINALKQEAAENGSEIDKKALMQHYISAGKIICKNYAGPVGMGILAVTSGCTACGIGRKSYNAIAAAATVISNDFRRYRDNVIEDLGENADYMYYHGLTKEKVDVVEEDKDTGKKKKVKKEVLKKKNHSDLSVFFDSSNVNHNEDPAVCQSFLSGVERFANERLNREEELYLADMYKDLGYTKDMLSTKQWKAARIMKWDRKVNPDVVIRIGIFEECNSRANQAVEDNNPYGENVYILDFKDLVIEDGLDFVD